MISKFLCNTVGKNYCNPIVNVKKVGRFFETWCI